MTDDKEIQTHLFWHHDDVIKSTKKIFNFFETLVVSKQFLAQKQGVKIKMIATLMKDNRLIFLEIYRKSQISFSFFEKIAVEV